jgi:ubiquitin carboxyl-terminal hydrolase 8
LELKHIGLRNLGNTCFFNSAVQCLLRISPLFEYVISPQFFQQINRLNPEGSGGRIATSFRQFAEAMCNGAGHAVSPSGLHTEICRKYPIFGDYGQHDSQELLGALLDGLHEDLNQAFAAKGGQPKPNLSSEADPWDIHMSRNSSQIVDLFHGALGCSIECPKCGYKKILRDPFSILSIPILRKSMQPISLESCLEGFTASEVLDADNEWKCDKCKKMVRATKRSGVHKCSTVLIIHLKRFEGSGWRSKKVGTPVTYPDVLDSSMVTGHANGARYKLIGAVFHGGTLYGGHYTAAAFDQKENQWYAYNDSHASPVDPDAAHSDKAYILFYLKSSP